MIITEFKFVSFLPVHLKAFVFFSFFFTMKCHTDRCAFSDQYCWCFKSSSSGSVSAHYNTSLFLSFHYLHHSSADSKSDSRWRCGRHVSTILCVHPRRCQPANCSGHGDCVDGRCRCQDGWQGAACDALVCQPPACGPHGVCTAGECGGGAQLQQVVENQNTSIYTPLWSRCVSALPHVLLCVSSVMQVDASVMLDGEERTAAKVIRTHTHTHTHTRHTSMILWSADCRSSSRWAQLWWILTGAVFNSKGTEMCNSFVNKPVNSLSLWRPS